MYIFSSNHTQHKKELSYLIYYHIVISWTSTSSIKNDTKSYLRLFIPHNKLLFTEKLLHQVGSMYSIKCWL